MAHVAAIHLYDPYGCMLGSAAGEEVLELPAMDPEHLRSEFLRTEEWVRGERLVRLAHISISHRDGNQGGCAGSGEHSLAVDWHGRC